MNGGDIGFYAQPNHTVLTNQNLDFFKYILVKQCSSGAQAEGNYKGLLFLDVVSGTNSTVGWTQLFLDLNQVQCSAIRADYTGIFPASLEIAYKNTGYVQPIGYGHFQKYIS